MEGWTYNSARRFCRRKDGNIAIFSDAILVVCHIMASIKMMCAETTVQYGMWSNKGGYVRRTKLFAGRVILGLRHPHRRERHPDLQKQA